MQTTANARQGATEHIKRCAWQLVRHAEMSRAFDTLREMHISEKTKARRNKRKAESLMQGLFSLDEDMRNTMLRIVERGGLLHVNAPAALQAALELEGGAAS